MANPLPSAEFLHGLLKYQPCGTLVWRYRGKASWDSKYAGRVVGHNPNGKGYRRVWVEGKLIPQHRVIWKMHHATEPDFVDHINGNMLDNRIENLRAATANQNQFNAKSRGGDSKYRGVYKARNGRWSARCRAFNKTKHLGTYDTQEEAALAYDFAARKMHGEFARTNVDMFPCLALNKSP